MNYDEDVLITREKFFHDHKSTLKMKNDNIDKILFDMTDPDYNKRISAEDAYTRIIELMKKI